MYVDLSELRDGVYFQQATHDPRFTWREIHPPAELHDLLKANPGLSPVQVEVLGQVGIITGPHEAPKWADGFRRFQLVDCAHREVDRDGALCSHCGHENPYEPPKATAARKARRTKK